MTASRTRWVLIASGDNYRFRPSLAGVRALASGGYRVAVTTNGKASFASASRSCVRRLDVPSITTPQYASAVRALAGDYLTVLPATDGAVRALGAPGLITLDKKWLAEAAPRAGLKAPPTRRFETYEDLVAAAGSLDYPIVIKPAISRPVRRVETPSGLRLFVKVQGPYVVQPYLSEPLRSIAGVMWRGQLTAVVHQRYLRTWPVEAGGGCAAESIVGDTKLEQQMTQLLSGFEGVFHAQLAGPYLLDVNPRIYGSLPLAVAAGANLPAIYCDLLRGEHVSFVRGRPGAFYRWIEGDMRYFRERARQHAPARELISILRPRRRTSHGPESLRDPGPMLLKVRYSLFPPNRPSDGSALMDKNVEAP